MLKNDLQSCHFSKVIRLNIVTRTQLLPVGGAYCFLGWDMWARLSKLPDLLQVKTNAFLYGLSNTPLHVEG